MHFLSAIASYEDVKLVMMSISQAFPALVLHRSVLLSLSLPYEGMHNLLSIN